MLLATDVIHLEGDLLGAAARAVGIGLLLHHVIAWAWRSVRRAPTSRSRPSAPRPRAVVGLPEVAIGHVATAPHA